MTYEPLRDDRVGLFMRLRFTLDDRDTFEVDTLAASDMLRASEAHLTFGSTLATWQCG